MIGVIVLLCILILGIGAFFWFDPLGIFIDLTPTITPGLTMTPAGQLTSAPSPSASPTGTPGATAQPAATLTAVPTNTLAVEPTSTLPPAAGGQVVLKDDFEQGIDLAINWRIWGEPEPRIESTLGLSFLHLEASEPFGAGVTSKTVFSLTPGLQIQFEAELPRPGVVDQVLALDWDAAGDVRQKNTGPGILRILIEKSQAILILAPNSKQCAADVNGELAHTYSARILDDDLVAFEVDGGLICQLPFSAGGSGEGRLSLSGMGLIDQVLVIIP